MNESQLQQSLVEWCRLHPRIEAREILRNYLVAVANGGERPSKMLQTKRGLKRISFVGQQLKKQGLKKGVSDLLLAYPSQGYHGLWLELKAANGRLTPEQIDWLNLAKKAGYAATVAYSLDQGMTVINNYLKVKL